MQFSLIQNINLFWLRQITYKPKIQNPTCKQIIIFGSVILFNKNVYVEYFTVNFVNFFYFSKTMSFWFPLKKEHRLSEINAD